MTRDERDVLVIRELLTAASLNAILKLPKVVTQQGVQKYVEGFIKDAGDPDDPIERVMVEQILLAHHRLIDLQTQASQAVTPEVAKAYSDMAVRLLAELRRMMLALRDLRTPLQGRSTTVIHRVEQLNQAEHSQQIDFTRSEGSQGDGQRLCRDTELPDADNPWEDEDEFDDEQITGARSGRPRPSDQARLAD